MGLKIRSMYATALIKFFVDHNLAICLPPRQIAKRFSHYPKIDSSEPIEVEIIDLKNRQGILLKGELDKLNFILKLMRENFFDIIVRKRTDDQLYFIEIEFPYLAKSALDELRNKVIPTVPNHHRLRIIAPEYVDLMEKKQLINQPEKREIIGRGLEKNLIWDKLEKGREIGIEHIKPSGKIIQLSAGEILEVNYQERKLILQRRKFKGGDQPVTTLFAFGKAFPKYDGLNLPKEVGDYDITEVREGNWFYQHSYYRKDGKLIGQYYNINTPIEFYPDKIRYIDLEINLIKGPNDKIEIVKKELLERQLKIGYISKGLKEKAEEIAKNLKEKISKA